MQRTDGIRFRGLNMQVSALLDEPKQTLFQRIHPTMVLFVEEKRRRDTVERGFQEVFYIHCAAHVGMHAQDTAEDASDD